MCANILKRIYLIMANISFCHEFISYNVYIISLSILRVLIVALTFSISILIFIQNVYFNGLHMISNILVATTACVKEKACHQNTRTSLLLFLAHPHITHQKPGRNLFPKTNQFHSCRRFTVSASDYSEEPDTISLI